MGVTAYTTNGTNGTDENFREWGLGVVLCVAMVMVLFLGGCRAEAAMTVEGEFQPMPAGGMHFGEFEQTARPRLGGLPYPGLFTLFELADPNHLGHHSYSGGLGLGGEKDRGIMYTCHGGFIDIAHARKAMDLTKHVQVRAEFALENNWSAFQVKSLEPSVYTVRLKYPEFWATLPPAEKKALAHELSIRIGQRMAMLFVTWHETLTYFGYQSTPLISEKNSAFTWDDTGAHAFGVMVAGRALHDGGDWDDAVTGEINKALGELGVVTPEQCSEAIERINGSWWSGSEPLRRQVEFGWAGEPVTAWVVAGLPFCKDGTPHQYYLPKLNDVVGRDFSGLLKVEITPNVWQGDRILDIAGGGGKRVDVDRDMGRILEYVRR